MLFVDDIDKINWQFESQVALLWSFYDWIYRTKKPCITTTNQSREWWTEKMGAAFARRLFDDAQRPVRFGGKSERGMSDLKAKNWASLPAEVKPHVRQQLAEEAKALA